MRDGGSVGSAVVLESGKSGMARGWGVVFLMGRWIGNANRLNGIGQVRETFQRTMKTNAKPNRTLRLALLVISLGLICMAVWLAAFRKGPWIVPVAEKARKNPLTASEAVLNAAKPVYDQKCVDCHGETGKGDGSDAMMYDPPPANLTDRAHMSKLTDGEIYYQITQGRKPMPSFKTKLTDEQRWQLVLLVRSFASGAQAAPTPVPNAVAPAGTKTSTAPPGH